eukprot:242779-Chlamydomonas_euryale.AAC.2
MKPQSGQIWTDLAIRDCGSHAESRRAGGPTGCGTLSGEQRRAGQKACSARCAHSAFPRSHRARAPCVAFTLPFRALTAPSVRGNAEATPTASCEPRARDLLGGLKATRVGLALAALAYFWMRCNAHTVFTLHTGSTGGATSRQEHPACGWDKAGSSVLESAHTCNC